MPVRALYHAPFLFLSKCKVAIRERGMYDGDVAHGERKLLMSHCAWHGTHRFQGELVLWCNHRRWPKNRRMLASPEIPIFPVG